MPQDCKSTICKYTCIGDGAHLPESRLAFFFGHGISGFRPLQAHRYLFFNKLAQKQKNKTKKRGVPSLILLLQSSQPKERVITALA